MANVHEHKYSLFSCFYAAWNGKKSSLLLDWFFFFKVAHIMLPKLLTKGGSLKLKLFISFWKTVQSWFVNGTSALLQYMLRSLDLWHLLPPASLCLWVALENLLLMGLGVTSATTYQNQMMSEFPARQHGKLHVTSLTSQGHSLCKDGFGGTQ